MKLPSKWKWLGEPLSGVMRRRLELCLGVVVTGAAVVGLSTVIPPDPSKLAPPFVFPTATSGGERRTEDAHVRLEPPPAPRVSPQFAHAVARGDIDAMDRLYTPGMPLDGMLALAAEAGDKAAAIWLLEREANVHEDEASVDAPVLLADAHPEMVALLLERGAAEPSLTTAAEANAKGAVLRLLAAHANVNPPDATPLTAAVSSARGTAESRKLIVDKLLAAGADPNRDVGDNPLAAAVRVCDGSREERAPAPDCLVIIDVLMKHAARVNGDALLAAINLDEAFRDGPLDAVLGGRLTPGATATTLAQGWNIQPREIKRIVGKGVAWTWHDGEDDAALPLLVAVERGDRDLVRTFVEAGAPVNVHFKDGKSPLGAAIDGASGGGNTDFARIVELLVARGADVNRRLPDGRTPLFAAAESGDLRIVSALLVRGARVNDLVLDDTALDAAEQSSHQPIARVLHARGGRRARKTASGEGQ